MLTDREIEEYQKLYKKEFGENISKQQALEDGIKLVNLIQILLKNSQPKNHQS